MQYVLLQWTEQESGTDGAWYSVVPADRDDVVLPPLPAEWEEHLPLAPADPRVQFIAAESSALDGYAAARLIGFRLINEDPVNQAPPGATVRLSLGAGTFF